jgi:hypothetical protein
MSTRMGSSRLSARTRSLAASEVTTKVTTCTLVLSGLWVYQLHDIKPHEMSNQKELVLFGGDQGWKASDWTDSDDRVRGGASQVIAIQLERTASLIILVIPQYF